MKRLKLDWRILDGKTRAWGNVAFPGLRFTASTGLLDLSTMDDATMLRLKAFVDEQKMQQEYDLE